MLSEQQVCAGQVRKPLGRPLQFLLLCPPQTLQRGGWRASLDELHDVDHFEILWNLTRKDFALTQVGRVPAPWTAGVLPSPPPSGDGAGRGHGEPPHWLLGIREVGGPDDRPQVARLLPVPHLPLKQPT